MFSDHPHVKACCRDGSSWQLKLSEYDSLLAAWKGGSAFWEGSSTNGALCHVKLADITGVILYSYDSLAAQKADDDEARLKKLTETE